MTDNNPQVSFKNSTVVFKNPFLALHKFSPGRDGVPVFIFPPHAGRHGCVVQNLIDSIVKAQPDVAVYAFELFSATRETKNLTIEAWLEMLMECQKIIAIEKGSPLSKIDLIGICQGGWLAAIYASFFPNFTNRLALFAAPINLRSGAENCIERFVQTAKFSDIKNSVEFFGGIQPGFVQWSAFAFANPVPVFFSRYMAEFVAILAEDYAKLDKLLKQSAWYDTPQNLAGTWFLDVLKNHFFENHLWDGVWPVWKGQCAKLENITCPLFVYAGADDEITHPEQAKAILTKASSKTRTFRCFPKSGHTAVFTRKKNINIFLEDFYGPNKL